MAGRPTAEDAVYAQDTHRYTIMSYFDADADGSATSHLVWRLDWLYAQTPMVHDIAAIQSIYGADHTTRSRQHHLRFRQHGRQGRLQLRAAIPIPSSSIWDGGGIDTLNLSGFSGSQTIRLGAGQYSSAGGLTNNLGIAFGCIIERAIGGKGADTIVGNAAANLLNGMYGNDILTGGAGSDRLIGGAGRDVLRGGAGVDVAIFNEQRSHYAIKLLGADSALVTDRSSGEGRQAHRHREGRLHGHDVRAVIGRPPRLRTARGDLASGSGDSAPLNFCHRTILVGRHVWPQAQCEATCRERATRASTP
jgi:Ca2+-binding RTX toxin-like protein